MIKQKTCERESQTVKAAKSGFESEEFSAHLKSCASCRETAKVVAFFQTDFENETPHLPAAGFLWWKSKIIENRRRQERVAQPILVAQIAAVVVFFAALVWVFILKSASVSDSLAASVGAALVSVLPLAASLVAVIACFAIVCLLFTLALRRYFTE